MNKDTFRQFHEFRSSMRNTIETFGCHDPVYNTDLDRFIPDSVIRYILVGDNPGYEESRQRRYLIGRAGQQARNFFSKYGLVDDFDRQVLVLNKTFFYTNSTGDLRALLRDPSLRDKFIESQCIMADYIIRFHLLLKCDLWIIGCSEMVHGKIFATFRDRMDDFYRARRHRSLAEKVFCYKHFSYGNFSRDLGLKDNPPDISKSLNQTGTDQRRLIFGW